MDWEAGDVVVRVRSKRQEGKGGWGRKDGGIIGRVAISVAEVSSIISSFRCYPAVCLRKLSGCQTLSRVTFGADNKALLGFQRTLTHLDGRTITIGRKGTTQPGEIEVVEGEGVSAKINSRSTADFQMPSYHDIPQGDMYIEYSVIMPTEVSESTRHSESSHGRFPCLLCLLYTANLRIGRDLWSRPDRISRRAVNVTRILESRIIESSRPQSYHSATPCTWDPLSGIFHVVFIDVKVHYHFNVAAPALVYMNINSETFGLVSRDLDGSSL